MALVLAGLAGANDQPASPNAKEVAQLTAP
jgi:hypothetical protein